MIPAPDPVISARAATRLLRLKETMPEAARLATLLSLAVRIEPPLLRAVRVAAHLGATVEADLWFSSAVATAGPRGISLDPAVADVLRNNLARMPTERDVAWGLLRSHHRNAPWSFRLEERINYLSTFGEAGVSEIEELLAAALAELRRTSKQDRAATAAIARWLLAALGRLPEIARATSAAAVAAIAAGVHFDGRVQDLQALGSREHDWLAWLLEFVPSMNTWVQRRTNSVRLGTPGEHAVQLEVPATDPLIVTVVAGEMSVPVRLHAGDDIVVTALPGPIELRLLNGKRFILQDSTLPPLPPPDPSLFFNRVAEQERFREMIQGREGSNLMFLVGEPGMGKTALLMRLRYSCQYEYQIPASMVGSDPSLDDPRLFKIVQTIAHDLGDVAGANFPEFNAFNSARVLKDRNAFTEAKFPSGPSVVADAFVDTFKVSDEANDSGVSPSWTDEDENVAEKLSGLFRRRRRACDEFPVSGAPT